MKLTTLDEDLRIHQKLEDEPNDVGGLSAQALKEKFDQAGVTIQKYLNETHLPEEEQAVKDALSDAKDYADRKVRVLEQASMKTATYDKKKRGLDVYDYTDLKIEELLANKAKAFWFASGACDTYVSPDSYRQVETLSALIDPEGLWSTTAKGFVVPEGGNIALLWLHIKSVNNIWGSECQLRIFVNGEERASRSGYAMISSNWIRLSYLIPLEVEAGDVITIFGDTKVETGQTPGGQIVVDQVTAFIFE